MLGAERDQIQKLQENTANCDQIKSKIERLQKRQPEIASAKERKMKKSIEPLMTRSRPDSKMEVDETPRSGGQLNLDRIAQEQMNECLDTWTPPEPVPSLRDLESGRIKPLKDTALPCLTPSSTSGSQAGAWTSRLKDLQERLQSRTLESTAREAEPLTWREYPVRRVTMAN